ncbi:MFS transporter [Actinomyces sp.]|uniref:CynX/NimT family MFS transporter n=1 Tax=Actinomyces sp. TaxID=29317 RepID=UPI00289C2209|nr:MFS transporter [Actinomyces sp.]
MDDRTRATRGGRFTPAALMTALVFLVALNLRPAVTALGPLLPQIGVEEGLDKGAQGLLGAVPVMAFALVSPLVHRASRRLGPERVVLAALLVLVAGTLVRSWAGGAGLWIGTVVVGVSIAVGNVLVPALVKRDYADKVSWATSIYSTCITVGSALAAATAVPLAGVWGWRGSLAFWAVPALVTAVLWVPRVRASAPIPAPAPSTAGAVRGGRRSPSVWRRPSAWMVTVFMGLQSTCFYTMVTWLPTILIAGGATPETAGVHMFVFQLVGIPAGLALPLLMRRPDSQVGAAVASSVPMLVGVLGLLVLPASGALWSAVAGVGAGASLVMAMTLIGLRSRTHQETTQLSGMAQSVGYLLAAGGPVLVGRLAQTSGGWTVPLVALAVVAALQVVVAVLAGRVPGAGRLRPHLPDEGVVTGSSLEDGPEED